MSKFAVAYVEVFRNTIYYNDGIQYALEDAVVINALEEPMSQISAVKGLKSV